MMWPPKPGVLVVDRWSTIYLVRKVLGEPGAEPHTAVLWSVAARQDLELGRGAWIHRSFRPLSVDVDAGDRCNGIPIGQRVRPRAA